MDADGTTSVFHPKLARAPARYPDMGHQLSDTTQGQLLEPHERLDGLARAVVDAALEVHKLPWTGLRRVGLRRGARGRAQPSGDPIRTSSSTYREVQGILRRRRPRRPSGWRRTDRRAQVRRAASCCPRCAGDLVLKSIRTTPWIAHHLQRRAPQEWHPPCRE